MVKPFYKNRCYMCVIKICCENGIFFVNDLISLLFTYEEFMDHFNSVF